MADALDIDIDLWLREDEASGREVFWSGLRIVFLLEGSFGDGLEPGGIDEFAELGVGDLGAVHPEAIDVDGVDGSLGGGAGHLVATALVVGAHQELAAGDPDHPWWRVRWSFGVVEFGILARRFLLALGRLVFASGEQDGGEGRDDGEGRGFHVCGSEPTPDAGTDPLV